MRGCPKFFSVGSDFTNCLGIGDSVISQEAASAFRDALNAGVNDRYGFTGPEIAQATEPHGVYSLWNLVFMGDSLTYWGFPTYTQASLGLDVDSKVTNFGVIGNTTTQMLARTEADVDVLYSTNYYRNFAFLWGGTNDILYDADVGDIYQNIEDWCVGRKAVGFQVFVSTITPDGTDAYEIKRLQLNTLLREDHSFADCLIDLGSDPIIGSLSAKLGAYSYFWLGPTDVHFHECGIKYIGERVAESIAGFV